MTSAVYRKSMQDKAADLVAHADKWAYGTRNRDGLRFILFPSQSRAGVYYFTRIDGAFCSCPAGSLSKHARCCHKIAAQTVTEQAREAYTKPRVTLDELYDNHLVSVL